MSERTTAKVQGQHGIEISTLRDELVGVGALQYVWEDDPERGLRALVEVTIRNRRVLVVLYPTDDPLGDVYNLGSAYFT